MDENTTILLADDHAMLRGSLKALLEQEPGMSVLSTVSNADQAVEEAFRLEPDVVILDVEMPGRESFHAARAIKSQLSTSIIFLSAFHHDRYIEQAIAVEASAYLTKAEPPHKLIEAIRAIRSGGVYYSPEIQARLVLGERGSHRLASAPTTRAATLTERELSVLRCIAQALSKKEIAAQMHVTVAAIDRHCTRIMTKLDIHDRVGLARFAIREGLTAA